MAADDVMRRDLTPDDPRPDSKPFYIHKDCPECGTPLVLLDTLETPDIEPDEIWHDEWICPRCREGIWMDWPQVEEDMLQVAVADVEKRLAMEDVDGRPRLALWEDIRDMKPGKPS